MGYSTIALVEGIVAQALTTGTPNNIGQPVDLLKIGNTFDTNLVSNDIVYQYIKWADDQIDSSLSELYATPLCEMVDFETKLLSNIDDYNDYIITSNRCPFYPGDSLLITDGSQEDRVVVESIVDLEGQNIFTTTVPVSGTYDATLTRVLRINYPDPIPLTSARLSAANLYEKYFMSQSSPNQSDYGKLLRQLARSDINNVLNGRTILHGQHRTGRRFFNPTLSDRYALPNIEISNNDIDQIS